MLVYTYIITPLDLSSSTIYDRSMLYVKERLYNKLHNSKIMANEDPAYVYCDPT